MKPLRLQPHLLTALLLAAMLGSGVPARAGAVSATTYYFAMSGNDANDGLSVTAPKRSLSLVPKLLAPGITVRLHRGDAWVAQDIAWDLSGLAGTAAEPMRIADYGDADQPRPVVSITPGRAGAFVLAKNTHHLTIANLDLRGGSAWRTARVEGDSRDVLFDNVSVARMAASAGRGAGPLTVIDGGGGGDNGGYMSVYYSASEGNDDYDGYLPAYPKKTLGSVPTQLAPGMSIYLKRGDEWYDPELMWRLEDKVANANTPMLVGAYGNPALPAPVVAQMVEISRPSAPNQVDGTWEDEGNQTYRTRQFNQATLDITFRLFLDGTPLRKYSSLSTLAENGYCFDQGYLHVRRTDFRTQRPRVETIQKLAGYFLYCRNVSNLTIQDITFKGGAPFSPTVFRAPTTNVTLRNLSVLQFRNYGIVFGLTDSTSQAIHNGVQVLDCRIDKGWSEDMNLEFAHCVGGDCPPPSQSPDGQQPSDELPGISRLPFDSEAGGITGTNNGANGAMPGGDGVIFSDAVVDGVIRGCTVTNMGHSGIANEINSFSHVGTHNLVFEENTVSRGTSSYCRGFNLAGQAPKCTNVIVRRNYFFDLTNSSHVGGDSIYVYSNIMDRITPPTAQTDNWQPYCFDAMINNSKTPNGFAMRDVVIANNTLSGALCMFNSAAFPDIGADGFSWVNGVQVANNIMSDWRAMPVDGPQGSVAIFMSAYYIPKIQFFKNAFWDDSVATVYMQRRIQPYAPKDVAGLNGLGSGYYDNRYATPMFAGGSGYAPAHFALTAASPFRMGARPLSSLLPAGVPAVDYNGVAFGENYPSFGAFQWAWSGAAVLDSLGTPISDGEVTNKDVVVLTADAAAVQVTQDGVSIGIPQDETFRTSGYYVVTAPLPSHPGSQMVSSFTIDHAGPLVSGVVDGNTYNATSKSATWTDASASTATLNGSAYASGALISGEGQYVLVVRDVFLNSTTIHFTIDRNPIVSGVTNGAFYSVASKTPSWTDFSATTATLNGVAYTQGTAITAERQHTLVVTDVALNSTTVIFTIDRTAPTVTGISNNGRYRDQTPIITFSDALTSVTATLDGDAFTSGNRVTDLGTHQLIVRDQANNTTTRNFTVYTVAP